MENKYYTPKLEELFVGYECLRYDIESQYHPTGGGVEGWLDNMYKPHLVCNPFSSNSGDYNMLAYAKHIENGNIRTPFLTKEQIEAEGWNDIGRSIDLWWDKKGSFQIGSWTSRRIVMHYGMHGHIGNTDKRMYIFADDMGMDHPLFEGQINSINEFRTIIRLLGI